MESNRIACLICFVLCLSSVFESAVQGAEFRSEERPTVEAEEVIDDDLYIFGDEVVIDGVVRGDVIAFGRTIRIHGKVEGDLNAAGQAIVIEGAVGDDARIAGQVLKLEEGSAVEDDLIAAGFSLEVVESASIGGDLLYAGYQTLLDGVVAGNVQGAMANCEIGGTVKGDVSLRVEGDPAGAQAHTAGSPPPVAIPHVPGGLTVRESASVAGGLQYTSRNKADISEEASIGEVQHDIPQVSPEKAAARRPGIWATVSRYATLLVLGIVVMLVAPRWTRRIADQVGTRPFASLGLGIVGVIGLPVALFAILVIMIAAAIFAGFLNLTELVPAVIVLGLAGGAFLGIGFGFFTCYLAEIVFSFLAGRWLLGKAKPTGAANRFVAFIVGLILVAAISSLPFVGKAFGWFVVLVGLGAVIIAFFSRDRAAEPVSQQPVQAKPVA